MAKQKRKRSGGAAPEEASVLEAIVAEAKAAAAAVETAPDSPEAEEEKAEAAPGEPTLDSYRAAAVAFFTRNKKGDVAKVLVALEERKVQASVVGLDQKGKVSQEMVVFPMGRREKKDKADCVDTVKREYIEETTNFGGLAKYLDFADFDGDVEAAEERGPAEWTGKQNLALFFAPALMAVLFCEVPAAAATAEATAAAAAVAAEAEAGEQEAKKPKPSPNYHVGKTDHLVPFWIDVADLRKVVESTDKAPLLQANGKEGRFFPTIVSALRLPEARAWLGVPPRATFEAVGK